MATLPENSIKKTNPMFWILPPVLFAISPLLYLYSQNLLYYNIGDLLFSMALFEAATSIVFVVIYLLIIKISKIKKRTAFEFACLFTTIFLLLFYILFAPAKQFLNQLIGVGFPFAWLGHPFLIIGPNKILLPVSTILFIGSIWIIKRFQKKQLLGLNTLFLIISLILIAFSLIPLTSIVRNKNDSQQYVPPLKTKNSLPDIYYIILDMNASFDVLKKYFDYDNSNFAEYLKSKGFYIAQKSRCNYPITILSLASSLNMKYFALDKNSYTDINNLKQYISEIQQNKLEQILLSMGYTYYPIGHWFFSKPFCKNNKIHIENGYRQSENLWENQLALTPIEGLIRYIGAMSLREHYTNTLFEFKLLENSVKYSGPKFVFTHIVCPHDPFVFHRDGSFAKDIESQKNKLLKIDYYTLKKNRYIEQVEFVSAKTQNAIDQILCNDSNAIVILQSDHGPWLSETPTTTNELSTNKDFLAQRMPILNAYHVPTQTKALLYDSISPVNSFRLILKTIFQTSDSLLPDTHFVIWYETKPRSAIQVP